MSNNNIWPRMEDDFMTIGEDGFIPTSNGWMVNPITHEKIDSEGNHYDRSGELIKESE